MLIPFYIVVTIMAPQITSLSKYNLKMYMHKIHWKILKPKYVQALREFNIYKQKYKFDRLTTVKCVWNVFVDVYLDMRMC